MPYLEFNKMMTQAYMLAEYGSDRAASAKFLRDAISESEDDRLLSLAEEWRARFDDREMRGSKFQNVMHGILAEVLDTIEGSPAPQTGAEESAVT